MEDVSSVAAEVSKCSQEHGLGRSLLWVSGGQAASPGSRGADCRSWGPRAQVTSASRGPKAQPPSGRHSKTWGGCSGRRTVSTARMCTRAEPHHQGDGHWMRGRGRKPLVLDGPRYGRSGPENSGRPFPPEVRCHEPEKQSQRTALTLARVIPVVGKFQSNTASTPRSQRAPRSHLRHRASARGPAGTRHTSALLTPPRASLPSTHTHTHTSSETAASGTEPGLVFSTAHTERFSLYVFKGQSE